MELTENIRLAGTLGQLADILDAHAEALNAINLTAFGARLALLATGGGGATGGGSSRGSDSGVGAREGWRGMDWEEEEEQEEAEADWEEGEAAQQGRGERREGHMLGGAGVGGQRQGRVREAAAGALDSGSSKGLSEARAATATADQGVLVFRLASRLGSLVQRRLLDLDPEGAVTLLHAYGKMNVRHEVLPDLVYVCGKHLDIYHARAVSNLVWALAALAPDSVGWAGRGWWEGLYLGTEERLRGFPTQALANTVWGLGGCVAGGCAGSGGAVVRLRWGWARSMRGRA